MNRKPSGFLRTVTRFLRATNGNVVTMTALTMPAGLLLAAVAIDEGSLFTEKRESQALTDLAAITAASNLGNAEKAVVLTLTDNGAKRVTIRKPKDPSMFTSISLGSVMGSVEVIVSPGNYSRQSSLPIEKRFVAGKTPINAVKVKLTRVGTRHFASSLIDPPLIGTEAIAGATAQAAFSIGSRLASLNGGILNAMLGALIGGSLSLSVMDYNALLAADIAVLPMLDALATELHLKAGTYDQVLDQQASVGQIAKAMASIPGLDNSARLTLQTIASRSSNSLKIPLSHLVDLGPAGALATGQSAPGLDASANALQMLTAAGSLANGKNQLHLDLGATLPGLLGASLELAVGEPPQASPWFAIGETGRLVRTAQTRLLLTVEIGGPGGLLGSSIKLPIAVELAFAEASLADISCESGSNPKVTIAARPGVAAIRIAEPTRGSLADFSQATPFGPARLIKLPLLSVEGQSLVEISNMTPTSLVFDSRDISGKAIKTVSTRNLTQSLTASLVGNLDLDIKVLSLGIGLPALVKSSLTTTLTAVTPAIDTLLASVLSMLGVRVGEADVRVTGASCGRAALVQ